MEITIRKPLYQTSAGDFVCIYDKVLRQAIKRRESLYVKSKNTEAEIYPKWWIKNGKKMKKEFLIKGVPMTLYCAMLPAKKTGEMETHKTYLYA